MDFSRNGGRRLYPAALTLLQAFNDFIKARRKFSYITEIIQYIQRLAHQGQGAINLILARRTNGILMGCRHKKTPEQNYAGGENTRHHSSTDS